ncbi:LptF/LptG family permease [Saprospiraceae bacterium]|nr:LptF/LptG family permease [Saprospiraceae bacterium]
MKKIDGYIIRKFLTTFLFTIMLITVVSIAIDLSEKVTRLMKAKAPISEVIFDYYLNFIPWIVGLLAPVFVLIAVIFFTARMAKNNEVLSILNAGVSYNRLLMPYMVAASIIAGILWVGGNFIIPKSTAIKNKFENTYLSKGNKKVNVDNVHFFLNEHEKAYVRYFRLRDTTMQGFRIETFKDGKLVQMLKTEKLEFKAHPNEWTLKGYTVRTFGEKTEGMEEFKGDTDTTFAFTPADFIRYTNEMETMTTQELRDFVLYEQRRGVSDSVKYVTEIQRRTADPFSIFILTLLGVSVSSRKSRGGMGMNLAIGIVTAGLFVMMQKFSATFAQGNFISPALGMWIPNLFFGIIVIFFVRSAQK